ncbi:MAG: response regulator [Planctomycetota bacterium]
MSDSHLVLLVGHCGPDSALLRSAASRAIPGATVEMVNSDEDLGARLSAASLLLVNRVLDGAFPSESGIELIRVLAASEGDTPPLMLISNYAEALEEAEAAGAVPGFGKAQVMQPIAAERMRHAVGVDA